MLDIKEKLTSILFHLLEVLHFGNFYVRTVNMA